MQIKSLRPANLEEDFGPIAALFSLEQDEVTSEPALKEDYEAQQKLYRLNDSTVMEEVLPDDNHSWLSFEEFQRMVCQASWYIPGGQWIAIDTKTGLWAAMSAITRFEGNEHATNLHTGVDRYYHGRGLAKAMLVLALRYARDVLQAHSVQTDESAQNFTAIQVYRELGYTRSQGTITIMKNLEPVPDRRPIGQVLQWLVSIFNYYDVPYQFVGGLAAQAYGATRLLIDIDVYVPMSEAQAAFEEMQPFIRRDPAPHQSASWSLVYLALDYQGVRIEIGDSEQNPCFFNQIDQRWEAQIIDYTASNWCTLYGVKIAVMPKKELVHYKCRLNREVDHMDIEEIGGTTSD